MCIRNGYISTKLDGTWFLSVKHNGMFDYFRAAVYIWDRVYINFIRHFFLQYFIRSIRLPPLTMYSNSHVTRWTVKPYTVCPSWHAAFYQASFLIWRTRLLGYTVMKKKHNARYDTFTSSAIHGWPSAKQLYRGRSPKQNNFQYNIYYGYCSTFFIQ